MADAEYGEYGAYPPAVSRGQKLVNIAGAAGSVMLVASLAWWGWDLAVRDARGVPVVRAIEGPMRVAPVEPGGQVVDHQGLAVNDVAAEGSAAGPADRLVLAPQPVELAAEDEAGLSEVLPVLPEGATAALDQPVDLPPVDLSPIAVPPAETDGPVAIDGGQDEAVAAALAMALGMDEATPEDPVETAALDDQGLPPPEGAITRSPRPIARPAARAAAPVAAAVTKPNVIDAATLAPGTRLVQFGAFDSAAQAEEEWMRLAAQFGDLMQGKDMVIQAAESGGRTFWRLRAHGFADEGDSRRFCIAIEAEGTKCIPVAHR